MRGWTPDLTATRRQRPMLTSASTPRWRPSVGKDGGTCPEASAPCSWLQPLPSRDVRGRELGRRRRAVLRVHDRLADRGQRREDERRIKWVPTLVAWMHGSRLEEYNASNTTISGSPGDVVIYSDAAGSMFCINGDPDIYNCGARRAHRRWRQQRRQHAGRLPRQRALPLARQRHSRRELHDVPRTIIDRRRVLGRSRVQRWNERNGQG